jgi:hypothetical protein
MLTDRLRHKQILRRQDEIIESLRRLEIKGIGSQTMSFDDVDVLRRQLLIILEGQLESVRRQKQVTESLIQVFDSLNRLREFSYETIELLEKAREIDRKAERSEAEGGEKGTGRAR